MQDQQFLRQLDAYAKWKADLVREIKAYQEWLDEQDMGSPEIDLRLYETLESLNSDRITIAFVAEMSRGKTELINTLFFSDYKRRLLPSQAGRTTMCPTELFFDPSADEAYIRLLPIETRLEDRSIAEYKKESIEWTNIELDVASADQLAEAFSEVTKVKRVSLERAKELGLYDETEAANLEKQDIPSTHVEVPMWRHALINFPHPLLKDGLVVLDTPGLNALGTEPELTLNMLPNAQAVLFLIAADTGVTKSDQEIWQHHVNAYRASHKKGLLVIMNKIDTLWDELKDASAVESIIKQQCDKSAEMLKIPLENVFPVSAQKGLLARVKEDSGLLNRSGIPALERALAQDVLPEKHKIISDNVIGDIATMVDATKQLVATKLAAARKQQRELQNLNGKNVDVIAHLLTKTREEQIVYNKNVEKLQTSRNILNRYTRSLADLLDISTLDGLVAKTRKAMTGSWTTHGMKGGMKIFFDSIAETMDQASKSAEEIFKLAGTMYSKFHKEHGFTAVSPKQFSTHRYNVELARLYKEAEAFRNSPVTTMTEQSFVVKKFFISLVSHARNIFYKANQDSQNWSKTVMSPLSAQLKEHKKDIEQRLATLRKISESRETLDAKITELEKTCGTYQSQLDSIDHMLNVINRPFNPGAAPVADSAAATS